MPVRLNLVANFMYLIYVNDMLLLALAVHKITRHFWAAYGNISFHMAQNMAIRSGCLQRFTIVDKNKPKTAKLDIGIGR